MLISWNKPIWGSVDQTKDMCKFTELKGSVETTQATGMESREELISCSYTKMLQPEEPGMVRQSQKIMRGE